MNIFELLGLRKKTTAGPQFSPDDEQPSNSTDLLYLWEDDYLMLELLHEDNLAFIRSETKRIDSFSKDHFDGIGFRDITPIGEKSSKTIEKLIQICDVEKMMVTCGLEQVEKVHMQKTGLSVKIKTPIAFGTTNFAIVCNVQDSLLEDIWLTGEVSTEEDRQKIVNALFSFGNTYHFIAVNWYNCTYRILNDRDNVEEFIDDLIIKC